MDALYQLSYGGIMYTCTYNVGNPFSEPVRPSATADALPAELRRHNVHMYI